MSRLLAITALVLLGGCAIWVHAPRISVASAGAESITAAEPKRAAVVRLWADDVAVVVTVRADDPYSPVRVQVVPAGAAEIGVSTDGVEAVVGAWRLGDGRRRYLRTRVPRSLVPYVAVEVPAGAELLLEFDPGVVTPRKDLAVGDEIAFDVYVVLADGRTRDIPVRLYVTELSRDWHIGLIPTH
jgi:hypothetical protein